MAKDSSFDIVSQVDMQEMSNAVNQTEKEIKATKLKVNTQMQGEQVRVSGAKKDDLQAVIQTLKAGDFGIDLQFINMR